MRPVILAFALATAALGGAVLQTQYGAAPATAAVSTPADAVPSAADNAEMIRANDECEDISDDWTWEACVIGAFTLNTGTTLTGRDYLISLDRIVLDRAPRTIGQ